MATAKAERLLNLVIALVNAERFRDAAWIRERVAGYSDAPSDEAFSRMFERDKQELRDLGIPLQVHAGVPEGYRIPRGEFALPEVTFAPAEAAALALAGRLWDTTALAQAGSDALRKLREAAPRGAGLPDAGTALLQPRVRTSDPAFAPLLGAVNARRTVRFDYRKDAGQPVEHRTVQPWGLVSYRGRWYLIGFDDDRHARRTFRLSRIVGPVKEYGRGGAVQPPPGLDLLGTVRQYADTPARRTAVLRVVPGRAAGLRRRAEVTPAGAGQDRDRVEIPLAHLWDTARQIAANGPDVLVESPPDLRDAVIGLLKRVVASDGGPDE